MEHELNDIKNVWQQAKQHQPEATLNIEELIAQAKQKGMSIQTEHHANLLVLSGTVVSLVIFFYFLYALKEPLTILGINLMMGGLLVRIGIEVMSLVRAKKMRVDQPTAQSLSALLKFHRLRKKIHGPITLIIVALYAIGFYALTPEISQHISHQAFVGMHISIPFIAVFLVMVGRRGIKKEMRALDKLMEIQRSLIG